MGFLFWFLLWELCGAAGWWIVCRYLEKKIDRDNFVIGIPISIVSGPIILGISIYWLLRDTKAFASYCEVDGSMLSKLYKKWD